MSDEIFKSLEDLNYDEYDRRIKELNKKIDVLNKTIAKFPHTADHVPVFPGMTVSAPGGDGCPHRHATVTAVYDIGEERDDGQYWASVRDSDENEWMVPVSLCYSINH